MCSIDPTMTPPQWIVNFFRYVLVPLSPKAPYSPSKKMDPYLLSDDAPQEALDRHFNHNILKIEIKPRFLTSKELIKAGEFIGENYAKMTMPFIVIHSKDDKVTSPSSSIQFYKNAASKEKVSFLCFFVFCFLFVLVCVVSVSKIAMEMFFFVFCLARFEQNLGNEAL